MSSGERTWITIIIIILIIVVGWIIYRSYYPSTSAPTSTTNTYNQVPPAPDTNNVNVNMGSTTVPGVNVNSGY